MQQGKSDNKELSNIRAKDNRYKDSVTIKSF